MKRIHIDTKLRFNQLNRIEDSISDMILQPFQEGKKFFIDEEDIPGFLQDDYPDKGKRAIDAYMYSSKAIIVYYALIIIGTAVYLAYKCLVYFFRAP